MNIIIAGSREFNNYELLSDKCKHFLKNLGDIQIVCGCAKGADELGEKYAIDNELDIAYFVPNWEKYGQGAGPVRNKSMARYADGLIAFWNGKSKGTKNMIETAKQHNLNVRIIQYE